MSLWKTEEKKTDTQRRRQSTDWSDVATSQGVPGATRSWKRQGGSVFQDLQWECGPGTTWNFWLPETWKNRLQCFKFTMFVVIYYSSHGKLMCIWFNKDSLNNNYTIAVNKSLRLSLLPTRSLHECSESDIERDYYCTMWRDLLKVYREI